MPDWIIELVIDESKWLAAAMSVAGGVVLLRVWLFGARRRAELTRRLVALWAMNLFYGWVIGIMAIGHLLAVGAKQFEGALEGEPALLYPMGVVLAVPSWWLAFGSWRAVHRMAHGETRPRRSLTVLNGWLAAFLLALGVQNVPLALPAILNLAHLFVPRPRYGWAIVAAAAAIHAFLFIGSLIFLVHGGSFEEFSA